MDFGSTECPPDTKARAASAFEGWDNPALKSGFSPSGEDMISFGMAPLKGETAPRQKFFSWFSRPKGCKSRGAREPGTHLYNVLICRGEKWPKRLPLNDDLFGMQLSVIQTHIEP